MGDWIDMTPEVGEALEEAVDSFVGIMAVEVIGSNVGVLDVAPEHVIGGRRDGGGYREDGFLGTAAQAAVTKAS